MTAGADGAARELFPRAGVEDIPLLARFLEDACRSAGVGEDVSFALRLATEEAFTNIVTHGYPDAPGPVSLTFRSGAGEISVTLEDRALPFDPGEAPPPDLDSEWDERAVGGLGWHLIRQTMDEVRHHPGPGHGNTLTLVKRLSPPTP